MWLLEIAVYVDMESVLKNWMGNKYFSFICLLALILDLLSWNWCVCCDVWVDHSWATSLCLCMRKNDFSSPISLHLTSTNEVQKTDFAQLHPSCRERIFGAVVNYLYPSKIDKTKKKLNVSNWTKKHTHHSIPLLQDYFDGIPPHPLDIC